MSDWNFSMNGRRNPLKIELKHDLKIFFNVHDFLCYSIIAQWSQFIIENENCQRDGGWKRNVERSCEMNNGWAFKMFTRIFSFGSYIVIYQF
jgi:hypothetical protein